MTQLYQITEDIKEITTQIELGVIDEEQAKDMLEHMDMIVKDKAINVAAYVQNKEADIVAMKEAESRIAERRKQYEKHLAWMREYLKRNMEANEITRIECPEFVLAIQNNPASVQIDNEPEIPSDFTRTVTKTSPDKAKIKEALKAGEEVPGARLVKGTRLVIK